MVSLQYMRPYLASWGLCAGGRGGLRKAAGRKGAFVKSGPPHLGLFS
jgi:hypothetical protein